jgi:sirohydrochlorin cobaltochelatase
MMTEVGLILVAHGARDARWAAPFEAVAARARAAWPGAQVRLAYLEFMSPGLAEACASLAQAGCTRVEVLPMFLGAGGHVRHDLPRRLDALREAQPRVHYRLHPAVGEIESVVTAMAAAAVGLLDPAS